jgi:hypothetical protein
MLNIYIFTLKRKSISIFIFIYFNLKNHVFIIVIIYNLKTIRNYNVGIIMNIVKNMNQYHENNIFFCEPIKNNIMNEGNFIRILYSTHNILLNGIYLLIKLNDISCEKYYNKYKCSFNPINHKDVIENIKVIEENILKKIDIKKSPQFKITEQLKNGNIKLFNTIDEFDSSFIVKISGIWETQYNYGLTYKFIKVNN